MTDKRPALRKEDETKCTFPECTEMANLDHERPGGYRDEVDGVMTVHFSCPAGHRFARSLGRA
jgi:hypothetical protein